MGSKKNTALRAGNGNVEATDMDKPLLELPLPEQRRLACAVLDWMHENIEKGGLAGLKEKFNAADLGDQFAALVERQSSREIGLTMDQAGALLDDSDRAALLQKSGFENKSSLHYTLKSVFPAVIKELTPGFRIPSDPMLKSSIEQVRSSLKLEMP
jgi:uncharacterized protein YidB (DUF937 family)